MLVRDAAKIFSCKKPKTLKFERRKGTLPGRTKEESFPPAGPASKWTQPRLLLTEGRTSLPLPLLKDGQRHCGQEGSLRPEACRGHMPHRVPSPPATPDEVAHIAGTRHQPVPSLEDSNMFDCWWMFLNVFNAIFPVLNLTTRDSNTEISKLLLSQNIIDLKICPNRHLGFVQLSVC